MKRYFSKSIQIYFKNSLIVKKNKMKFLLGFLFINIVLFSCSSASKDKYNDFTLKHSSSQGYWYSKRVTETLYFDSKSSLLILKNEDFEEKKIYLNLSQEAKYSLYKILQTSNLKSGTYFKVDSSLNAQMPKYEFLTKFELSINKADSKKNMSVEVENFMKFYFAILQIIRKNENYQKEFPEIHE